MDNYIPDQNRFKLAGPPEWWLRLLKDFDSSLYVVPSRQGFYYRLAQKRPLRLPAKLVNDLMAEHADTAMLASYGLIPVTTINPMATWSPLMLEELAARAPWRQGGAQKVIQRLEEGEAQREARKDAAIDDRNEQYAKAGYMHYKRKTGQRTYVKGYQPTASGILIPS